jgi:hypothetical protein
MDTPSATQQEKMLQAENFRPSICGRTNSIPGNITEIIYGGAIVNYRVRCALGELEACRIAGQGPGWSVGDAVYIGWAPESGALLSDGASA